MAEYEYGRIDMLNKSLKKFGVDEEVRRQIMKSGEEIKKTDDNGRKQDWFCGAMNTMDELLDNETKQKVRGNCACCLGGKRETLCKQINRQYASTEEKIRAINETHYVFGNEIKITGSEKYEVSFFSESNPSKRCSCWKDDWFLRNKMSRTYCLCCGGHVKHHLETVLGKEVKVRFISSVLTSGGKKNCRFELTEV